MTTDSSQVPLMVRSVKSTLNCTRFPLRISCLTRTNFIQLVGFVNMTTQPPIQPPTPVITGQGILFNCYCHCHTRLYDNSDQRQIRTKTRFGPKYKFVPKPDSDQNTNSDQNQIRTKTRFGPKYKFVPKPDSDQNTNSDQSQIRIKYINSDQVTPVISL